ncbi:hypothetical protein A4G19_02265 [Pasteurellaceae bacterium Macca]|nr:hypothetical protein [Pasteurellaceae bacterium Macca]
MKKMIFPALLLLSSLANAQMFKGSGIGNTLEEAKKDAVTNAIKFSVGEFIVNKEELNNDDFSQKVVSHSNAYVKKIDVISEQKMDSGYKVVVNVDIESQVLIKQLQDMNTVEVKNAVNNKLLSELENYFDKQKTEEKAKQDFADLVDELLVKPINEHKQVVHLDVTGELTPIINKQTTEQRIEFELPIQYYIDKDYLKSVEKVIGQMGRLTDNSNKTIDMVKNKHEQVKRYKVNTDYYLIFREKIGSIYYDHFSKIQLSIIGKDDNEIYSVFFNTTPQMNSNNDHYYQYEIDTRTDKLNFYLSREQVENIKDIKLNFIY